MALGATSTALAASASAMECDDAPLTSEDAALIASIVSILEREGDLNEASCAGRRALEETLDARDALAEGGEEPDGVVEALEAIAAIWELCEIGFFDVARRRGSRLAGWLRRRCVDWAVEEAEFDALLPLLARLETAPEAWTADGDAGAEAGTPFWQLAYRLACRGRCADAWAVLKTHSTMASRSLSQLWAPLGRLLETFPDPPDAADDDALETYAARLGPWKRDAARARRAAEAGDAPLLSAVPPARALFALLDGDVDAAAAALGGLGWEDELLARLLFFVDAPAKNAPYGARVADVVVEASSRAAAEDFSEARRQLFNAVFKDGDAASAIKVVHALAGESPAALACCAAIAVLAKRRGDLFPGPPPGQAPLPDVGAGLLGAVAGRATASDWRLGARLLLLGDDRAGYRALLARADPADDAGAWELARLAAAEGQAADARRVCDSRGDAVFAAGDVQGAAAWYLRAELLDDDALRARGERESAAERDLGAPPKPSSRPFAVDGRLETLCGAEAASLVAALGAALAGGAPGAFEAAANRAAAIADALGHQHDADDRERAGLGALIVAARHGPEASKLLRLARVALAAVAGDAFGAGFRASELPRALVVALGERGEARGEPGSAVAEELTALLAFVLHVLRRAAASQPDPLRYVASGPPAKPPFGSNDCLVLLDATQRNAARRDAGLLDDGALATLNHLLVEALAVAFAFENHDDRERNLPAMDLGDEDAVAPPLTRAAADLLEDPDLF